MAVVVVARVCAVTVTLLSVFLLTVLMAPRASAAVTEQLSLTGCTRNDAFLLVDDDSDSADDALTPMNPAPVFGDNVDFGIDDNLYDGSPGVVYWGNSTSDLSGTFGTAQISLSLSDIVDDSEDYWSVDVAVGTRVIGGALPYDAGDSNVAVADSVYLSVQAGWRKLIAGSWVYGWATSSRAVDASATPVEDHAKVSTFLNIENNQSARPWTTEEINQGQLILLLRFDSNAWGTFTYSDTPVSLILAWVMVQVQSEVYTPPPTPTAESFILYPDEDLYNYQWHPIPTDDLFDNLNETTQFGDGLTTYVRAAWDQYAYCRFNFEDPPDEAPDDTYYAVTAWMIAKENVTNANDQLGMSIELLRYTGGAFTPYTLGTEYESYDLTTSWFNYTIPWVRAGGDLGALSTVNWTLSQLANVTGRITMTGSDPYGGVCVTQFALLCTPVSAIPVAPIPNDFSGVLGWLADGGIRTILGLMGFCMVLMGPTIMVLKGRDDDGTFAGYFIGLLIIVMGIGFLWAGLAGHWA